jgi:uncharacterized protein (TIGR00725 family)
MRKPLIGVMGPGDDAPSQVLDAARELGSLIAGKGWNLVNGGRSVGVMNAVSKGAKEQGGFVIGVLPNDDDVDVSDHLDIVIRTGMGQARNNINVLSADIVVSCGMNPGTASEVALAIRAKKHVVMLHAGHEAEAFFGSLDREFIHIVTTAGEAAETVERLLTA